MNMKKAVAAAFGAALLSVSTGVAAHGVFDSNTTGKAKVSTKAKGGTATGKATSKATVKASTKASKALVTGSSGKTIQHSKSSNAGGDTNASVKGGATSGSVHLKFHK